MLAHRFDEDLHAWHFDLRQHLADFDATLGGRPPGAAVADNSRSVECAEVATNGYIAGAHREVDSQSFQDAATNAELEGVVTEKSQMAGPAARGDAWQDG